MANSLQEQLLKAGLVDKDQVNKAKKAKQQKEKQRRHAKQKPQDEAKSLARAALEKNLQRDRELNRQRQTAARAKAIAAEVDQLIHTSRLPQEDGEIAYNFTDGGKIRRLHVAEQTQRLLSLGQLAIVKLHDRYELVPAGVAEKIAQRDATRIVLHNTRDVTQDADDPYAAYQVPDDLIW